VQSTLPCGIVYTACYSNNFSESGQEGHGRRLTWSKNNDADASLYLQPTRIDGIHINAHPAGVTEGCLAFQEKLSGAIA
jgi:hypothetical protein